MLEAMMCPECRKTVPADAPQGLCPTCMMQLGLGCEDCEQVAPLPSAHANETVTPPGSPTVSACSTSSTVPVNVPGYEILGELGRGGMGVVY